jgi:hypothetical protein
LAVAKRKIDESILAEYQQLLTALQKVRMLYWTKPKEIKNLILDEIIKRYQYQEGLYQYYIKTIQKLKKALSLLNNTTEYKRYLRSNESEVAFIECTNLVRFFSFQYAEYHLLNTFPCLHKSVAFIEFFRYNCAQ